MKQGKGIKKGKELFTKARETTDDRNMKYNLFNLFNSLQ
jgi:hypothetical protein